MTAPLCVEQSLPTHFGHRRPALHGAPPARQQACRAMLRRALEDILA